MLSVPFWGAAIVALPAATEPPVGSCCANEGNGTAMTSESALAITQVASGADRSAPGSGVEIGRIHREERFVVV